jgi:hypothetical protein
MKVTFHRFLELNRLIDGLFLYSSLTFAIAQLTVWRNEVPRLPRKMTYCACHAKHVFFVLECCNLEDEASDTDMAYMEKFKT